eukprot:CAMPEP_0185756366 /NCGR_PEP_ID=MMETSP1174-20130828/14802_1 /TAXON_ID=35687 /ORGANISM="Dictyocha speculum, Strain CCMP1381" /LENGTH=113 /DNA_ID=CAMNT_0028435305 /DNA_START=1028 /DNA_END=1370 /DNA_ORIENTATION=+
MIVFHQGAAQLLAEIESDEGWGYLGDHETRGAPPHRIEHGSGEDHLATLEESRVCGDGIHCEQSTHRVTNHVHLGVGRLNEGRDERMAVIHEVLVRVKVRIVVPLSRKIGFTI